MILVGSAIDLCGTWAQPASCAAASAATMTKVADRRVTWQASSKLSD
jgi:hypothetical protein